VGELLGTAFRERSPLLAVDSAGCLPYFSGLPALDMLGLNDRHLAWNAPAEIGTGWIGHEAGDGDYVLRRQPDLIVFCSPAGGPRPCFRSGIEMFREPAFHRDYRLVAFETAVGQRVRSRIWVRADSHRIGMRMEGNRIVIPGFLFASGPGGVATLDEAGQLAAEPRGARPLRAAAIPLVPGYWRYHLQTSGASARVRARAAGSLALLGEGGATGSFELPSGAARAVDLEVEAMGGALRLRAAILEPLPDPVRLP
jgi:hypothetical protein